MNSPGTTAKDEEIRTISTRRIPFPVGLVVVFGIILSIGVFLLLRQFDRTRFQHELDGQVGSYLEVFTDQIDNYAELLYTLRSLFLYSDSVTRDEFRGVATDLLSRYLGIQALEWIPRVASAERSTFESAARREGYPDFNFTQRGPNGELIRAADRPEHWPIYYLEPYLGNERALGFDIVIGPNSQILSRARDTGEMHVSEKIRLVQETGNQSGLVALLPVYDVPEKTLLSAEERQAHFRGFVQSVYRIGDLMETTFRRLQGGALDVMIIDQGAAPTNRLIYTYLVGAKADAGSALTEAEFRAGLHRSISYPIGGRRWEFIFRPAGNWQKDKSSFLPLVALLTGFGFTGLLAVFVHGTVTRKEEVERTVQERTLELSQTNQRLQREIGERQQTEMALRKSQTSLLQAQRIGEIGSWEVDLALNKLSWSAETYRIFGQVPEGFVLSRESFLKTVHPDDRNKVVQASTDALAQGGNYWVEHRIVRPDGTDRYVREQAEVIRNDQGQAVVMVGTVQDITERKRAETALSQSESLYRGVFEATSDGMAIADCNGFIRAVNQSFCAMHGRPRSVCLELPLADFIQSQVWERLVAFMKQEQWEDAFHALTIDQREDGSSFEVELTGTVIHFQGEPHYLLVLRDISERRRAEEAIGRERNLLRTLIDSLPDDIYIKDIHGRYLMVNEANRKLLGLPNTESAQGKSVFDFAPEKIARMYAADDRRVLETDAPIHNREEPFDLPGGGKGWFLTTKIPLRDATGEIIGLIGISRDITERKREELDRHIMERKLQETQKLESLGVLAGGIAHDFNNLLTGILGNASLARLDLPPMSPIRPYLEQIESASQRAAELCKQMLAYSGKGRFVVQHLDLSALVEDTMHLLQLSISKKAVMRFNLARSLPAVSADATQMRQIIMNLVINASDAIGDKSGVISVCTGMLRADRAYLASTHLAPELPEGDYVFLEVSDNGCGMSQETLARIFDPFFTTKFTGRGLGLAAVLGIVRGHKGALKVYTEVGRGSTFKMLLPCAEGPAEEFRPPALAASPWRGEGTVLVVDDEETVRTVTARMLESFGFTVMMAADGREGVQRFRDQDGQFACVMLDLTMPHLDGEETFREIRRIRTDTRVLLMSGFNEQDAVNRFSGKGLAGFIQKPFKLESLRDKIRQIVEAPKSNL